MKRILFILLLLPTLLLAQTTDSWVNFKVHYDFYAPTESTFFMVGNSLGDTVMYHQPTSAYQYLDTTININSGSYTITLNDNSGDGWISNQPAHFKLANLFQGLIIDWDPVL